MMRLDKIKLQFLLDITGTFQVLGYMWKLVVPCVITLTFIYRSVDHQFLCCRVEERRDMVGKNPLNLEPNTCVLVLTSSFRTSELGLVIKPSCSSVYP